MMKALIPNLKLFAILILAIALQSCSRNPVTGKKEIMFVSESQELAMGVQADPGIVANYGLYDDKKMQDFINQKGKQMAAISHRPNLDYKFRILDSPVVNAFAVPGGYVYFTRGIMAHFNNEAEFAGVLGHEIGHITARHSAAQMSKQQLYSGLLMGGMILSPELAQFGQQLQQGLGLMFLKFGRDDESQSDELGVEYSTKIGYDSHEMANFFGVLGRLQQQSGQSLPDFMSTHPNPVNRFAKVHEMSDEIQTTVDASKLKINRDSYLNMINGMVYGEDPRQGYVENANFYHPDLKFQFPIPGNWKVGNTPQMVQIVEPNGKAIIIMTVAAEKTLEAAAQAAIQTEKLQVIESSKVNVNGIPALAMVSEQVTQDPSTGQQRALSLLTYFIQYNGLIYKFHGMSTKADFSRYVNAMSNTMKNFRSLNDPTILNKQPEVISIERVTSNSTLKQALVKCGINASRHEEAAILNNMKLTDQLKSGTLIKTLKYRKP